MDQFLQSSLETMNLTGQQQPLTMPASPDIDDIDKIIAGEVFLDNGLDSFLASVDPNDINTLIDNSSDPIASIEHQFSETSLNNDEINQLLDIITKQEPTDTDLSQQNNFLANFDSAYIQQSIFIEEDDSQTNSSQSQFGYPSPLSVPVGNSPVEPKASAISDLIYAQSYVNEQHQLYKAAAKPKKHKSQHQRTTNVGPVEYIMHSGACQPCTTAPMQYDYAYQQQLLEYDALESKQIQILGNPRSKFRPRTQNESKASSHYLRCEDHTKPEYPTIALSKAWNFQSDVNLIEVALMGLDKQPHPYSLENKNSSNTYEDTALIFKQNDPNVLYFRLQQEDFDNGFKTFMIELIKAKQDDVITKDLIRSRQLEHSMLRFTRIYQVGKGNFLRDEGSEAYSTVMSEAYGEVEVEHMGPRYGPINGQEMVFVVLKGRILKSDLKIEITETLTGWNYSVENFTKNGNIIYFLMPAFPYPECQTVTANIIIYYKGDDLFDTTYLYKGSLDQELAQLRLNDSCGTTASSSSSPSMSMSFNAANFFAATNACPSSSSRRSSTVRRPKRLSNKPIKNT